MNSAAGNSDTYFVATSLSLSLSVNKPVLYTKKKYFAEVQRGRGKYVLLYVNQINRDDN